MSQPLRFSVTKYIPDRLFGFATSDTGQQVFFHLGAFNPQFGPPEIPRCEKCPREGCTWASTPPAPILGEPVEVLLDDAHPQEPEEGHAPRAVRVTRLTKPLALTGMVETFDAQRGYGFVRGSDGISYHLHRSEIIESRIPLPDQTVMFYAGVRENRPRACHVRVCP